jgi:hypothetical protein
MFEATFKIAVLVQSNEQGQHVYQLLKHTDPLDGDEFIALVARVYEQDMYRNLQVGEDLTVSVRIDLPPRIIERTLHFREDRRFEGDGLTEPTAELRPLNSSLCEHFRPRSNQAMFLLSHSRFSGSSHR